MAMMARDILAIPGAGVGVKRQFSDARAMGKYNRKYASGTFSDIMFLRSFYQTEERRQRRVVDDAWDCMMHTLGDQYLELDHVEKRAEVERR